jgi:predicted HAD superfamily phosphohydrolase
MQGLITDYKESLRQRVALLKGVTVQHMEQVFAERLRFNPGAQELITAAKAAGLTTLLVSGGFTFFADRVKAGLGIDFDEDLARAHPFTGTGLHLQMQEAPCDYRHGNRFEGGAPAK